MYFILIKFCPKQVQLLQQPGAGEHQDGRDPGRAAWHHPNPREGRKRHPDPGSGRQHRKVSPQPLRPHNRVGREQRSRGFIVLGRPGHPGPHLERQLHSLPVHCC